MIDMEKSQYLSNKHAVMKVEAAKAAEATGADAGQHPSVPPIRRYRTAAHR
jgi:hypothetical protein